MSRMVAISAVQRRQTGLKQAEMAGFLASDADPVGCESALVEPLGADRGDETAGHVEGEVDGVELDMGDGVKQRGAALRRPQPPAGDLCGRHEARADRSGRSIRGR